MKIEIEVNIDTDEWSKRYGCQPSEANEDAKSYIPDLVKEILESMSLLGEETTQS